VIDEKMWNGEDDAGNDQELAKDEKESQKRSKEHGDPESRKLVAGDDQDDDGSDGQEDNCDEVFLHDNIFPARVSVYMSWAN
jgi:hypothetical protein